MNFKLEVVVLPVTDVDRAKSFYESLGWRLDADFPGDGRLPCRPVHATGFAASIIFGSGVTSAAPGSAQGLYLVVDDIEAAREDLAARGVDVSEVYHDAGGVFEHAGTEHQGVGTGSQPDQLRVVRVVQRPRRQRLAAAGDSGAPTRPLSRNCAHGRLRPAHSPPSLQSRCRSMNCALPVGDLSRA